MPFILRLLLKESNKLPSDLPFFVSTFFQLPLLLLQTDAVGLSLAFVHVRVQFYTCYVIDMVIVIPLSGYLNFLNNPVLLLLNS